MLVCLTLDKRFVIVFFSCFCLSREGLKDKTYPAMNLSVNGESNGERIAFKSYDHLFKCL